jgi:hypothetical protein
VLDARWTAIRIRGIGSDGFNAGIDPSVGVYIDGIAGPHGRSPLPPSSTPSGSRCCADHKECPWEECTGGAIQHRDETRR